MEKKSVWEILVPTTFGPKTKKGQGKPNNPVKVRYHQVWDKKVKEISGGLTVHSPSKGSWIAPTGEVFDERMIPVKIICTREEFEKIIDFTLDYYGQLMVLGYKISDEFIMKSTKEQTNE